jgi:hypothetical protein
MKDTELRGSVVVNTHASILEVQSSNLDLRPTILTEVFGGFRQFLQSSAGIEP